jgi:amidohydrolase
VGRSSPLSNVRPEVLAIREDVIAVRRDIHRHPELSWKEERTGRLILEKLKEFGLADVRPVARTGATGLVEGAGSKPAVLWRADIDALPVPERTGLPFASKVENVMHACGHDVHIAIALGIARILARREPPLPGPVRFLFQPAEESEGGAQACLAEGILDAPRIDRVLGFHISADLGLGAANIAPGPFFAAPTKFEVVITGRGGHAAAPHQTVDAVVVAAHAITALQTVVSRSVSPAETAVLTVGKVQAGYRGNVIAESAVLNGTIRSYTDRTREYMLRRTEEILAGVCAAFGATFTFTHATSCPPVVNDPDVTADVLRVAEGLLGHERIHAVPSMGADDMAVFLRERPGCYFWLGARNEAKGIAGRHHDPGFVIDEDAIPLGIELGLRLIEDSLSR